MNPSLASKRPAEVLLVEDVEGDALLMRVGFERANLPVNLHRVVNGEECLAFLRRQRRYAAAPRPDLILLDLNMPLMDGREVMTELAADDRLRHLPVVVLTTSADERDILDMYKLRASSYIVKPVDLHELQRIVQTLFDYWFTVVALPSDRNMP